MSLIDEVAKVIEGKGDAELAREAHAHLWVAFLYAPTPELEREIERISRIFVAKYGHGMHEGDAIRNEAMARMVAFDAMRVR